MPRPGAQPLILIALLVIGTGLAVWGPWDVEDVVALGEVMAERPWLLLIAIALQAALFTLALPGSLVLWAVAPFYPPWLAAPTLVAGSTLGALGAYALSWYLGGRNLPADTRWIRMLRRNSDFFSQCAIRAMPGFPHPPLNYGAGTLRLPLPTFIAATIVGLGIKWGVFSAAIYEAMEVAKEGGDVDPEAVVLLLIVVALFIGGALLRRRLVR